MAIRACLDADAFVDFFTAAIACFCPAVISLG
jgi:hypothetical protein